MGIISSIVQKVRAAANDFAAKQKLEELGYQVQPSSSSILGNTNIDVVVSNIPPTREQWIVVFVMAFGLLMATNLEFRRTTTTGFNSPRRRRRHCAGEDAGPSSPVNGSSSSNQNLCLIWRIGLLASGMHNIDNILRPGSYYTPVWIVKPVVAFPMDRGFIFWYCVLALGILSLHLSTTTSSSLSSSQTAAAAAAAGNYYPYHWILPLVVILLHSLGTSIGAMHYMVVESPVQFTIFANATIMFEVIMGLVVGWKLIQHYHSTIVEQQRSGSNNRSTVSYETVTTNDQDPHARDGASVTMEMSHHLHHKPGAGKNAVGGIRQRSVSPKI